MSLQFLVFRGHSDKSRSLHFVEEFFWGVEGWEWDGFQYCNQSCPYFCLFEGGRESLEWDIIK